MLTEQRVSSGNTYTTTYTYDNNSRVQSITYPDGTLVTNQYDTAGRLNQVSTTPSGSSTNTTVASSFSYEPFGPRTAMTFGNGIGETATFDLDYRPLTIIDALSGVNKQKLTYTYDAANNLKTITDAVNAANTQTLTYDVLERIKTATSGTGGYGSLTYTYDAVSNLTSFKVGTATTTYSYTPSTNQLSAIGSTTVSTNANGNITGIPPVGGGTAATFAYNNANRLSSVTGTLPAATFVYDAFGRRFSKTNPSSTPILYFFAQDGSLIEENNSGMYTDYLYANGRPIVDLQPGATPSANQINYILADRQGTPQSLYNSTPALVWSTTYQPYGQGGIPTSAIVNDLRLPGQNYDMETGFHYNMFRDYMPNLGRYLEADPIGLVGGMNPYLYANANPSFFTDPQGLLPVLVLPFPVSTEVNQKAEQSLDNTFQQAGVPQKISKPTAHYCVLLANAGLAAEFSLAEIAGKIVWDYTGAKAVNQIKVDYHNGDFYEEEQALKQLGQDINSFTQYTGNAVQNWLCKTFTGNDCQ